MRPLHLYLRRKVIVALAAIAALVGAVLGVMLAACGSKPSAPIPSPIDVPVIVPTPEPLPPARPLVPPVAEMKISQAKTARDYRKDAAIHLYALNQDRLYPGKLPAQLHAIGVLQVQIDHRGNVTGISWMRAPRHAPKVMAEIERSVRKAAPFPLPMHMGKVTYTDTWLWDISGRFQLDTLTEGQL